MQLTKNFDSSEFACKCGKCDGGKMSPIFMDTLQAMRNLYAKPMVISSGFRCPTYNSVVGGKPDSNHMKGIAADITYTNSMEGYNLLKIAFHVGFTGVGVGGGFIHVDCRNTAGTVFIYK